MTTVAPSPNLVRQFRQILLWPLQLAQERGSAKPVEQYWAELQQAGAGAWERAPDMFDGEAPRFKDRHYAEFITFMPYVQRFLYGDGGKNPGTDRGRPGASPIRLYRRTDVARMRVTLDLAQPPVTLGVEHVHLYFFADIDVVMLAIEIFAEDLTLGLAQDLLFRNGRAYPAFWRPDGQGGRCPRLVEWVSAAGDVLSRSDYEDHQRYLTTVAKTRAPCIAMHWEWLLKPLVSDPSAERGPLRYRQLEYYRMPLLAYLAFDDPGALTFEEFVSLGLVTGPPEGGRFPFSGHSLEHFEEKYCYDHYWAPHESHAWTNTRFICTGHTFLMIGSNRDRLFIDPAGLLGQFRRQYFILALIAHFHKAALLMLSDRLVVALNGLDAQNVQSIKRFKRTIRRAMETFLRFTHRYWFHEVSTQDQARELFAMWRRHLDTERLFEEVRQEIQDMSDYLSGDSLRRQANTVVRLTVVTTLGLVWTIATGVLGMNIFDEADNPWFIKLAFFAAVFLPTVAIVLITLQHSKRLADFLDVVSEEGVSWWTKVRTLRSSRISNPESRHPFK
ncbi:MAG: CorA family divalent cation transporter [Gemmatimonadaceae bacterium]